MDLIRSVQGIGRGVGGEDRLTQRSCTTVVGIRHGEDIDQRRFEGADITGFALWARNAALVCEGAGFGIPASIAGLPVRSAMVLLGPPLSARVSSRGSSCVPGQLFSIGQLMLLPRSVTEPPQLSNRDQKGSNSLLVVPALRGLVAKRVSEPGGRVR